MTRGGKWASRVGYGSINYRLCENGSYIWSSPYLIWIKWVNPVDNMDIHIIHYFLLCKEKYTPIYKPFLFFSSFRVCLVWKKILYFSKKKYFLNKWSQIRVTSRILSRGQNLNLRSCWKFDFDYRSSLGLGLWFQTWVLNLYWNLELRSVLGVRS